MLIYSYILLYYFNVIIIYLNFLFILVISCIYLILVLLINYKLKELYIFFFSNDTMGRIRVLSIKVALATMCSGKLMDKLRCKLINN